MGLLQEGTLRRRRRAVAKSCGAGRTRERERREGGGPLSITSGHGVESARRQSSGATRAGAGGALERKVAVCGSRRGADGVGEFVSSVWPRSGDEMIARRETSGSDDEVARRAGSARRTLRRTFSAQFENPIAIQRFYLWLPSVRVSDAR